MEQTRDGVLQVSQTLPEAGSTTLGMFLAAATIRSSLIDSEIPAPQGHNHLQSPSTMLILSSHHSQVLKSINSFIGARIALHMDK